MHTSKQKGQILLVAVIFVVIGSLLVVSGVSVFVTSKVKTTTELLMSKESYLLAEGAMEEVTYRAMKGMDYSSPETLTEGDITVETAISDTPDGIEILSVGDSADRIRKLRTELLFGDGVAFAFGVQTDTGGIVFENSSSVKGNVFSNGTLVGSNNYVYGDAISAGASGLINNIHATGSAYAHTIQNAYVGKDAYYQTISGTTVVGLSHPGSPDLGTSTLPITDGLVSDWESAAASGTVISSPCPYNITGTVTLGPAKITCDVVIGSGDTLKLSGAVWITGNLTLQNTGIVRVDPAIGNKSVPIIVDNPANRLTSSKVLLQQSGTFIGNGNRSYVLILSGNRSASQGGGEKAITVQNSISGSVLLYAGYGEIVLQNSAELKEVTAWRLRLQNSAQVIYESGIANSLFTTGPTGGYEMGSWEEVQ